MNVKKTIFVDFVLKKYSQVFSIGSSPLGNAYTNRLNKEVT